MFAITAFQSAELPLPPAFVIAVAALFGAIIGSFLNVVIHRVPRGEFFASSRSRCPSCESEIKFYDNIPVISWLLLGGKCRNCAARISPRYPLVEALTAALFALVTLAHLNGYGLAANNFGLTQSGFSFIALAFDCAFVAAMIALIFIDYEFMILPDVINFPGFAFALIARLLLPNLYGVGIVINKLFGDLLIDGVPNQSSLIIASLINSLLGVIIGAGSLWLVGWAWKRARGVEAMGLGDVKMMLFVGAYLGWALTLLTMFLGFLSGAIIGVIAMYSSGERDMTKQIPFGIFLGAGAIASLLFGTEIISWYVGMFR